jgi:dolichyl-phosphate beta-glucosyltransferase
LDVSIVLPVYNGASFVEKNVETLALFLARQPGTWEIVVVDDGSTDGTDRRVRASENVRVVRLPENLGKFAALKAGMAASRGQCRIFTDADLPYDLEAIPHVAALVNGRGFHLVVGDRTLSGSVYGHRSTRAVSSRAFSLFVRLLVTGGLFDTQCGLKGFRGDVADALFPLLTIRGFAGDVELLYIALKYNLEIRRIPVRLHRAEETTVRFGTDVPAMLRDIARLRGRWASGRYASNALEALAAQDYWQDSPASGDART